MSPEQPWMTDRRWRSGKIADGSGGAIFTWCLVTVIWNAVAVAGFIALFNERKRPMGLLVLMGVLSVIGFVMLGFTIRLILMRLKYGQSVLELETFPGQVGGYLAGTIRASTILDAPEGIRLKLQCVNRVTVGHGKQQRTREDVKWESEQVLNGALPAAGGFTTIPVAFKIPSYVEPTRDEHRDDIVWQLVASAKTVGVDYEARFIVPVFITAATPVVPKAEALAAKFRQREVSANSNH
jgi:hypothetical protein